MTKLIITQWEQNGVLIAKRRSPTPQGTNSRYAVLRQAARPIEAKTAIFQNSLRTSGAKDAGEGKASEAQPLIRQGIAQVPVEAAVPAATTEVAAKLAATLAGASPHAPHTPGQERRIRKGTKEFRKTIRISGVAAAEIAKRAAAEDSEEAPFLRAIIYAHLKLPIDREQAAKHRELQRSYADLTIGFNRVGTLLNQIAAATNKGQPCSLSRSEIEDMRRQFSAVLSATIRKLGFD
jgi:predicted nucleic acid-binding protein